MSTTDTRRADLDAHDNGGNEATASDPNAPMKRRPQWLRTLALAGPAFVVGAWQFGPGNLASAVQAGSGYGYALIWVIVISTILMIFFTDMSVRLGMRSPASLIQSIKDELGKPVGVIAGIGVFFITLMFSVGNAVGSGLGLSMLFGGSPILWTVVCTIVVFAILLFRNVYRAVERVLITIVAIMAIAFIVSAIIANAEWAQNILDGKPNLSDEEKAAAVADQAACLPASTRPFGEVRMAVGTGGYKSTGFTMVKPISGCGEIAVSADWTDGGNGFRRR